MARWEERTLAVDGVDVRVAAAGTGPPLLFLPPSAFLRARRYAPALAGLTGAWRVLAPELPGTGASAAGAARADFGWLADWAARFLDAAGVERALVAGHSTGGGVALALAARHPARVAGLVLAGTAGVPAPGGPLRVVLGRIADGLPEMRLNLRAWPDLAYNLLRHPRAVLAHVRLSAGADLLGEAARVAAPTLILWGGRDRTFPVASATRLRDVIPGATLIVHPRWSHDWLLLEPTAFAADVARWAPAPSRSRL